MAKETFYFSHDYDPTGDPKMAAMLSEHGGMGYGCFWRITEMLHSDEDHRLPLKKYIFMAIAKQMLTEVSIIENFIKNCIEDYELFVSDGEKFWSNRVDRNLGKRAEISEKRAFAGRLGGIAKQNQANAKQNVANKKKGNESKKEEASKDALAGQTPANKEKTISERCRLFVEYFNKQKNSKYTDTDKVQRAFKKTIGKYKSDQLIKVIQLALKDPKHIENDCMYITPEFVLRPEIIERYLNAKPIITSQEPVLMR